MLLGNESEKHHLPPRSLVVVEPGTPVQIRNESDSTVIFFAYGAPRQEPEYKAEILDEQ
jgi:hypothetical protein